MTEKVCNFSHFTGHTSTLDPEDLVQCPYDPNHIVRKSRLPYHIRDCKKNNPVAAKNKKKTRTCPFNSLHIVPANEFEHHKQLCPDKDMVQRTIIHENQTPSINDMPIINHQYESSENWEDDTTESEPFILNGTAMIKHPSNTSSMRASTQSHQPSVCVTAAPVHPFKYAGVGRGVVLPPNKIPATVGPRTATSSVGFSLDTLRGKPSFPLGQVPSLGASPDNVSKPVVVESRKISNEKIISTRNEDVDDVDKQDQYDAANKLKEEKKLKKKLKSIQLLEADLAAGKKLDSDQMKKLDSKVEIERKLASIALSL